MWEMILAGRYMMIPIGIASLVGLAVLLERLYTLRHHRIVVPEIVEAVETLRASEDFSVAYAILDRRPGPFATIVRAGLDHAEDNWQVTRDVLQEAGRQEHQHAGEGAHPDLHEVQRPEVVFGQGVDDGHEVRIGRRLVEGLVAQPVSSGDAPGPTVVGGGVDQKMAEGRDRLDLQHVEQTEQQREQEEPGNRERIAVPPSPTRGTRGIAHTDGSSRESGVSRRVTSARSVSQALHYSCR